MSIQDFNSQFNVAMNQKFIIGKPDSNRKNRWITAKTLYLCSTANSNKAYALAARIAVFFDTRGVWLNDKKIRKIVTSNQTSVHVIKTSIKRLEKFKFEEPVEANKPVEDKERLRRKQINKIQRVALFLEKESASSINKTKQQPIIIPQTIRPISQEENPPAPKSGPPSPRKPEAPREAEPSGNSNLVNEIEKTRTKLKVKKLQNLALIKNNEQLATAKVSDDVSRIFTETLTKQPITVGISKHLKPVVHLFLDSEVIINPALKNFSNFIRNNLIAKNEGHRIAKNLSAETKSKLQKLFSIEEEIRTICSKNRILSVPIRNTFDPIHDPKFDFSWPPVPRPGENTLSSLETLHKKRMQLRAELEPLKSELIKDQPNAGISSMHSAVVDAIGEHYRSLATASEFLRKKYPAFDLFPMHFQDFLIVEQIKERPINLPIVLPTLSASDRQELIDYGNLLLQITSTTPANKEALQQEADEKFKTLSKIVDELGRQLNENDPKLEHEFLKKTLTNAIMKQVFFPEGIDLGLIKNQILKSNTTMSPEQFVRATVCTSVAALIHTLSDPRYLQRATDLILEHQVREAKKVEDTRNKLKELQNQLTGAIQKQKNLDEEVLLQQTIKDLEQQNLDLQKLLQDTEPLFAKKASLIAQRKEAASNNLKAKQQSEVWTVWNLPVLNQWKAVPIETDDLNKEIGDVKRALEEPTKLIEAIRANIRAEAVKQQNDNKEAHNQLRAKAQEELDSVNSLIDEKNEELNKMFPKHEPGEDDFVNNLHSSVRTSSSRSEEGYKKISSSLLQLFRPVTPAMVNLINMTGIDGIVAVQGASVVDSVLERLSLSLDDETQKNAYDFLVDKLYGQVPPTLPKEVVDTIWDAAGETAHKIAKGLNPLMAGKTVINLTIDNPALRKRDEEAEKLTAMKRKENIRYLVETKVKEYVSSGKSGVREQIDDFVVQTLTGQLVPICEHAYGMSGHSIFNQMLTYSVLASITANVQ